MASNTVPFCPQWQPIETAPRDGTVILVRVVGYGGYNILEAYWPVRDPDANAWEWDRPEMLDYLDIDTVSLALDESSLTHWMPLPEPPEVTE